MKYIPLLGIAAVALMAATGAHASEALAQKNGCVGCHKVDAKLVGPAYKDVAAKYTAKDIPVLVKHIKEGSSGAWGTVAMPAHPALSEADATELAKWVLSRK